MVVKYVDKLDAIVYLYCLTNTNTMKTISSLILSAFLLISTTLSAQELKMQLPEQSSECTSLNWKNGEGTYVKVDFVYKTTAKVPEARWRELIMDIMIKSKFRCKNKLSFVPKKLVFMSDEDTGGYSAILTQWCSNAYGTPSEVMVFFIMDAEGNITKTL